MQRNRPLQSRPRCSAAGAHHGAHHGDQRPCPPCPLRPRFLRPPHLPHGCARCARCTCALPPRCPSCSRAPPPGSRGAPRGSPAKPIRLIVPFPPGGGTDMIARTVAQKMAEQNRWSVVVDNRPGAGGNLGLGRAAKAAPDGDTVVLGQTSNLAINPALYPQLPYDPLKDLVPVALLSSAPMVLVTHPKSAFKTYV